jgi:hypothetical protein
LSQLNNQYTDSKKMEFQMSFFKKLFAVGSTVALLAAGAIVPSSALAAAHGAGSVVKTSDGTVYFINSNNHRAAFTSAGAFLTYGFLSWSQVVDANTDDLALAADPFIAPRDGSIFCATSTKGTDVAGECALITGGMKAAFTSASVFSGQGYSFARAQYGDSSFLAKTSNIDNAGAAHRQGALVNQSGTVYLVGTSTLLGIPSVDVFNSWGYSFADVVPANAADMSMAKNGVMCARIPGQLNPSFTADSCGSADNGDDNGGPLQGDVGDITVTTSSLYNNEEVGEDEQDVPVLAFKVEAGDDSDVRLTSVKVELEETDVTVSQDLEDYADEVSVWNGDSKLGSADADSFSEDSDVFTRSISLSGNDAIVRMGQTETFSVAISALDNLDSADILTDDWTADVLNVRFEDADGVVTTTSEGMDADQLQRDFDFTDFATAADVELRAALNQDEDDINDAHNILVNDDDSTDNEPILAFTLKAEGDSDINVSELTVRVTGSDSQLDTVVSSGDLYHGSTKIASDDVTTTPGVDDDLVFDDLDIDINAGDTEEFTVKLNILEADSNYAQGATLQATLVTASTEAEDENGDDVDDLTGSAIGGTDSLFSNGITVEVTRHDTDVTPTDVALGDTVQFTWELDITNVGDDDVYINADNADVVSSNADATADDGALADANDVDMIYTIQRSGTNSLASTSGTVDSDENDITADSTAYTGVYATEHFFRVSSGDEIHVTITVSGTNATAAGTVRAFLAAIEWTTDDITAATAQDATAPTINSYTAQLPQDSETPYKPIN